MFKQLIHYYLYKVYWVLVLNFNKRKQLTNSKFTIGVTTFKERYDVLFRDLIMRLYYLFPNSEIIVAINGHYNQEIQKDYLEKITAYCQKFPTVKIIFFREPEGLSKLWNRIIIKAQHNKIFLLNDDVLFKKNIIKKIRDSSILSEQIALIDNSFSHFIIDKSIIRKIGWFDERLREIGGEDDDFHVRLRLEDITLKNYSLSIFRSFKPLLKTNSYGNIVKEQIGGYSNFNTEFLLKKWDVRKEKFEGAININRSLGCYWKLKIGMETPKFYKKLNECDE